MRELGTNLKVLKPNRDTWDEEQRVSRRVRSWENGIHQQLCKIVEIYVQIFGINGFMTCRELYSASGRVDQRFPAGGLAISGRSEITFTFTVLVYHQ